MTNTDDEPKNDMSDLIADAMIHPDAGMRLLVMIVLTHASVNGGDPAWDPEFAIDDARTTLENDDTEFEKIQVSVTSGGQAYRIDPGPIWSASRWPLVHRLIDIALMDSLQTRIRLLTSLMAALQEHGDTDVVVEKTDEWFTPDAAREALASMVAVVAADEQIDRRFWNMVGLTNSLAIQNDHHGIWIAVDAAREFLFDSQPEEMGVPFVRDANGEIIDIVTEVQFPDHDLVELSKAIALTPDPLARQVALGSAVLSGFNE